MRLPIYPMAAALIISAGSVHAQYVPGSLAAYWPLDETNAAELQVDDVSGNGNHGTRRDGSGGLPILFPVTNGALLNGNGPVIDATPTNAAEFDDINDVLVVDECADLAFDKQRGSISFWINTDADDRMSILRVVNSSGAYVGPSIEKTGSSASAAYRIFFHPNIAQAGFFMAEALPTNNVWQHYVFTWDYTEPDSGVATNPNRVKCYVNGVQTTNRTSSGGTGDTTFTASSGTANGDWIFGRRHLQADIDAGTTRPFDGEMAEIAVFDTDIGAADALSLYNSGVNALVTVDNPALAGNLVSYWNFSEGTGTSVSDDAGTCAMYTSEATEGEFPAGPGPIWTVANSTGKPAYISRALQFDGSNDLFTVEDSPSMDFNKDQGSVVMWAYFNTVAPVPRIGIFGDTSGSLVSQVSSSGRVALNTTSQTNNLFLATTGLPNNTWVHLAFVFDRSQPGSGSIPAPNKVKIYANGVLYANVNAASSNPDIAWTATALTDQWVFGRRHAKGDTANPRWMNGQMADVAVFSTPLSPADIIDIRDNGVADFIIVPDTDKPTSSATISAVAQIGSTINVDFVSDDGAGSGVASTALWVKTPSGGAYADSGLTLAGTSGSFAYTAADGNGLYQFYTVSTDNQANTEDAPAGEDDEIAVSLAENTAVPLPFSAVKNVRVFPLESGLNAVITLSGVSADGIITVSRTEGSAAPIAYSADRLLAQQWVIADSGGLAFSDATLVLGYDEALLGAMLASENDVDLVIADDGGVTTPYSGGAIAVDTVANTLTVNGVTGFSTWYAGNNAADVTEWNLLD